MTEKFHGVIPPVVTPLTADGEVDVVSFERSLNRMIEAGVDGLFTLGSSGEVAFSTDKRRREIIETVMRIVDGRVPVLVGCIDTETNRVIEHARKLKSLERLQSLQQRHSTHSAAWQKSSATSVLFTKLFQICHCSLTIFQFACTQSFQALCL